MNSQTVARSLRWLCFGIVLCLLSPHRSMAAVTISLKAVAKNGIAISPTSTLQIQPGDLITADIFISGWNNPPFDGGQGLIRTYQVKFAGVTSALSSNACGSCNSEYVLPLGWDAPLEVDPCPCDHPCFPVCDESHGCIGESFSPSQMAQIDTSRIDWIFHGLSAITAVDVYYVNVRWGSTLWDQGGQTASRCSGGSQDGYSCSIPADCPGGICDPNYRSYLGTLKLKAGAAVCGTYTISFEEGYDTFIINDAGVPGTGMAYPATQGLTLTTGLPCTCVIPRGACCIMGSCHTGSTCTENVREDNCLGYWGGEGSSCATLDPPCTSNCPIVTSPPNCSTDARRPYPPNQPTDREGFSSWIWTFPSPLSSDENTPNDFTIRQVPSTTPPVPPVISSMNIGPGNAVTFHFSAPIQPDRWTCVEHNASGLEKCLGSLPGDADGSRTVGVGDIIKIIDNLNGLVIPPLAMYQCDIDRSGVCAPADILTEIDLLNGASGFLSQNGRTLETCPSR